MRPNSRLVRGWLTLAAFLVSFVLPLATAGHLASSDAACVTGRRPDSSSSIRLEDAAGDAATEHCPLCHFQRAAGGAAPSHRARIAAPAGQSVAASSSAAAEDAQAAHARSSRAPPAIL